MRDVAVLGWFVAFAAALALVTRRAGAWIGVALLALPAVYLYVGVRYGSR